jgi:hypothetical protein
VGALAALAVADAAAPYLQDPGDRGQIAWLAIVSLGLMSLAVLAVARLGVSRKWGWLALAAGVVTAVLSLLQAPLTEQTVAKLVCAAALGCFVALVVQSTLELVVIAGVIAASDIASVLRGPTHEIAAHHTEALDALSLHFHIPGTNDVASLGMTDVLFFAAFLTIAARLNLRVGWTWVAMTVSLSATALLASWTDRLLPALPLLAAGAVAANLDLLIVAKPRAGNQHSDSEGR